LSTAEFLRPHADRLLFIGGETGPERRMAEKAGLEFIGLPAAPLRRSPTGILKAASSAAGGWLVALGVMRRFQPDLVLATGGYAAVAAGLAASALRIPLVLEEPNAVPGKVTRLLAPAAALIATGLPGAESRLPFGKTIRTGYPIRQGIAAGSKAAALRRWNLDAERPVAFVYGGSQGAYTLNETTLAALPKWTAAGIQVLHSAGRKLYEDIKSRGETWEGEGYRPVPYVESMEDAYAAADLIVCRGGASSLSELAACGKPAVIVPYPHHADRHQIVNARVMQEAGAAIMVENRDAAAVLPGLVMKLMADSDRRRRMAEASRIMGRPHASEAVASEILRILGGRG
jgi:UDP-N-acetylglucosamine--N-acetylmuramyl-(pentapeptide) pyrophosphoryl-undecaprenol N-acetylglucosamine transferase